MFWAGIFKNMPSQYTPFRTLKILKRSPAYSSHESRIPKVHNSNGNIFLRNSEIPSINAFCHQLKTIPWIETAYLPPPFFKSSRGLAG